MAHRTNVTQVPDELERDRSNEKVKDVICGMELNRHDARHVVYRPDQTYYFCSETCRDKFISGKKVA